MRSNSGKRPFSATAATKLDMIGENLAPSQNSLTPANFLFFAMDGSMRNCLNFKSLFTKSLSAATSFSTAASEFALVAATKSAVAYRPLVPNCCSGACLSS